MAEEVGVAFVRLVPSLRGFGPEAQRALNDEMQGPADAAGEEAGGRFGGAFSAALAGAGVVAGAVLVGGITEALDQGKITAKLGAQLGATPAEAKKYGEIAGSLYSHAVTEDFQGAADAIKATMGAGLLPPEATNQQIESISTKVANLANTFDQDLGGVTNAVSQMMRTGLASSADEAFDVLTVGFQSSANKADDLLDTVNEYGTQFRKAGLDGATAMGLLDQAIQAGARDSDIAADAIKEFSIRAVDGSKSSADGFKALGLNADDMAAKFGAGGKSATEALDTTLDRLRAIKDPVLQSQAAVALFGTQAEDLGSALYAMDPSAAADGLGKVGGAADTLGKSLHDNAGAKVEQFKRTLQQGFVEFLGNSVIPAVSTFVGFLADHQTELKAFATVITAVVVPALVVLGGRAMWAGLQMARAWVVGLGPIAWAVAAIAAVVVLVIAYWDEIKTYTGVAWDWVAGKVDGAKDAVITSVMWLAQIPGWVGGWFGDMKDRAVTKATELAVWVAGWPGRIYAGIAGLGAGLSQRASTAWQNFRDAAVKKAAAFGVWVAGWPGQISKAVGSLSGLLYSKGQDVVRGLWNGIKSMGDWIYGKAKDFVGGIVDGVKSGFGIFSPSKVMAKEVGRYIPPGIVKGWEANMGEVKAMAARTAAAATSAVPTAGGPSRPAAAAAAPTVVLDAHGMPRALVEWLRNAIRTEAGGSAERFFKAAA